MHAFIPFSFHFYQAVMSGLGIAQVAIVAGPCTAGGVRILLFFNSLFSLLHF